MRKHVAQTTAIMPAPSPSLTASSASSPTVKCEPWCAQMPLLVFPSARVADTSGRLRHLEGFGALCGIAWGRPLVSA